MKVPRQKKGNEDKDMENTCDIIGMRLRLHGRISSAHANVVIERDAYGGV